MRHLAMRDGDHSNGLVVARQPARSDPGGGEGVGRAARDRIILDTLGYRNHVRPRAWEVENFGSEREVALAGGARQDAVEDRQALRDVAAQRPRLGPSVYPPNLLFLDAPYFPPPHRPLH